MLSNMTTLRLQDKQRRASQLRGERRVERPLALLAPPSCTDEHCLGTAGLTARLLGGGVISRDQELELTLFVLFFFSSTSSISSNSSRSLRENYYYLHWIILLVCHLETWSFTSEVLIFVGFENSQTFSASSRRSSISSMLYHCSLSGETVLYAGSW